MYEPFIALHTALLQFRLTLYFTALPLIHLPISRTLRLSSILRVRTATVGCSGDYALLVLITVDHR